MKDSPHARESRTVLNLDSTRWILDFRYWVPVFFCGTWIPDSNRYGPINVKPAGKGGGGVRAGHGVGI